MSGGNNNEPYVGDPNRVSRMAGDLHAAYLTAAANAKQRIGHSAVDVTLAGDAWITAMNAGIALVTNPYPVGALSAGKVDLWDSNALDACCTTPIGYHPSVYGFYLNALMLFTQITGVVAHTGYRRSGGRTGHRPDDGRRAADRCVLHGPGGRAGAGVGAGTRHLGDEPFRAAGSLRCGPAPAACTRGTRKGLRLLARRRVCLVPKRAISLAASSRARAMNVDTP